MPYGHLYAGDEDRGPAGPGPSLEGFADREPGPGGGAGSVEPGGGDGSTGPVFASCGTLLGDFLARMRGIEADFTVRWDAARLGGGPGPQPPAAQPGWRHHV